MGSITPEPVDLDVLIVGAGFSGVYALYMIRKLGLSVKVLEDHRELRPYFSHVADVLDLRRDTIFNAMVNGASWDGERWNISTEQGVEYSCKYFIPCTGFAFKKHYPAFSGIENFKGLLVHAAEYPENLDVTGKCVGVIGNGATGVQCIQELAREDCKLTAFIRNINTAYPMGQRDLDPTEQHIMRSYYNTILLAGRSTASGYPYNPPPSVTFLQRDPAEQARALEDAWRRGGFTFNLSVSREFAFDKKSSKARARVTDPAKRDIVAPKEQPYWIGTKWPSLEQYYFESIDRPNVEIVDLKANPVQKLVADGIVTSDGKLHLLDVLLLATGYDFWTRGLTNMNIKDKRGVLLQEKWASGCETHLGMLIPDCPNLFYVFGPQSPAALANALPVVESQVETICKCLEKMRSSAIKSVEPQQGMGKKWRQVIQDQCARTLYSEGCNYYVGSNIPGKPREQLPWMGGVEQYINLITAAVDNWDGFELVHGDTSTEPAN